jgi:hypothetical protein
VADGKPGALVDVTCPVEWGHSLNRGLLTRLMVLPNPGWRGGAAFRDLVRGGKKPNDGTLTNMAFPATTTSGWCGPKGRAGGYGCMAFDGSDDYVSVPSAALGSLSLSAGATAMCWFNEASNFNGYQALFDGTTGGSGGRQLSLFLGGFNQQLFAAAAGSTGGFANLSVTLQTSVWYHVAFIILPGGGGGYVYLNGVKVADVGAGSIGSAFAAAEWRIGGNPSTGGAAYQGYQDDVRLVARALSASEVFSAYSDSRRGSPETVRWLTTRAIFPPQAAGGTDGTATATPLTAVGRFTGSTGTGGAGTAASPCDALSSLTAASANGSSTTLTSPDLLGVGSLTASAGAGSSLTTVTGVTGIGLLSAAAASAAGAATAGAVTGQGSFTGAVGSADITSTLSPLLASSFTPPVTTAAAASGASSPSTILGGLTAITLAASAQTATGLMTGLGLFNPSQVTAIETVIAQTAGSLALGCLTASTATGDSSTQLGNVMALGRFTAASVAGDLVVSAQASAAPTSSMGLSSRVTLSGAGSVSTAPMTGLGLLREASYHLGVVTTSQESIVWAGSVFTRIAWAGIVDGHLTWEGGYEAMQESDQSVKRKNPELVDYTFANSTGAIDLTPYSTVKLLIKVNGQLYDQVAATFDSPKTGGRVYYDGYQFLTPGRWYAQFLALTAGGVPLYGDEVGFDVVNNLDDLAADEQPQA